jgi:hypothetical protein
LSTHGKFSGSTKDGALHTCKPLRWQGWDTGFRPSILHLLPHEARQDFGDQTAAPTVIGPPVKPMPVAMLGTVPAPPVASAP